MLRINDEGKAEIHDPSQFVEVPIKDIEALQEGLTLLKQKYPEISKECFP